MRNSAKDMSHKNKMDSASRKIHIDFIKILAILLVIFNHTGQDGFLAYQRQDNLFLQIIQMFFTSFCKIAVPLYFMCSGALLMGKEESTQKLWKKRILKFALVIIGFTVLYYAFLSFRDRSPFNISWILKNMYSSSTFSFSGSYWFLYSYIAFLIMLPILRIIAKHMTKEVLKYILVLHALFSGALPIFEFYFGLGGVAVSVPFATSYVFFYPLVGYYLEKNDISLLNNKKSFWAMCAMSIISITSSIMVSLKAFRSENLTESYFALFGGFLVIFTYLLIRDMCKKISVRPLLQNIIREVSGCTFGIYLLHGFAFTLINDVYAGGRYLDAWIKVPCVFISCLLIAFALRRIPVINKLL